MAELTAYTFLYYKTTAMGAFAKYCDIIDYPDIFTAPDRVEVSNLSSNKKKYIAGMIDTPTYEFNIHYIAGDYQIMKATEGDSTVYWQIRFQDDGSEGMWQWQGDSFLTPTGGGVGDVRQGKITLYQETDVTDLNDGIARIIPLGDIAIVGTASKIVAVTSVPTDCTITAVSATTAKATVSVSGHNVTVTGVAAGTSVITVTAAKTDYTSATETFTVTVS